MLVIKRLIKFILTTALLGYLCFGIVKVDIVRKEISDTYFVGVGNSNLVINNIWANDTEAYAATEDGVLRDDKSHHKFI
ncbi:MAG: hypothetical protein R2728_06910 [Chitinophagales bacterium]